MEPAVPLGPFMSYSLRFGNRLAECFAKKQRPTRLVVAMLKELDLKQAKSPAFVG
jgi:hypothetical protein